jgi:DNA invertase Pin-like site-specific DNA recombinase
VKRRARKPGRPRGRDDILSVEVGWRLYLDERFGDKITDCEKREIARHYTRLKLTPPDLEENRELLRRYRACKDIVHAWDDERDVSWWGLKDVEEITDTVSGVKSSREGLDRLMKAVRRGTVDVVMCYKLDRLGRSLSHLAQIIDELTTNNVALVVPGQGIDTSSANPAAKLQLQILCAVAEFEREVIRERVNAGLAVARAKGVKLGRPVTLEAHRSEVTRLRRQGHSGRAIAKELGIPSSSVFKLIAEIER